MIKKDYILYFVNAYLSPPVPFMTARLKQCKLEQDLESIKEKGKITVLTDYSSTDYFIYRVSHWVFNMKCYSNWPIIYPFALK